MSMSKEEIERHQAAAAKTTALQTAFKKFQETGVKFQGTDAEVLAKFKEGGHEIFVEDGVARTKFDSEILPLDEALLRYAFDAPQGEVDRRTLPRGGAGTARSSTLSRATMTTAEKVAYVNEHGEEAFLKIPTNYTPTSEVKTTADWLKLSRAERVRRTTDDPQAFEKLLPAPGQRMPWEPYVNHEALERQKQIRPAPRRG
jgi:hypothetical protein